MIPVVSGTHIRNLAAAIGKSFLEGLPF